MTLNRVNVVGVMISSVFHLSAVPLLVSQLTSVAAALQSHPKLWCISSTGQVSKFIVNTVNAGAGALAVTVEGPSKVKLECREVDEGYEFTYCPKAPGDYLITIRYAGVNVAGSPFKARVEGRCLLFPSGFLVF